MIRNFFFYVTVPEIITHNEVRFITICPRDIIDAEQLAKKTWTNE